MSQPLYVLTIQDIKCRNLRSADFLSKNDVYVVFRCGENKCKTKYMSRCGNHPDFKDVLTLELTEAELGAGRRRGRDANSRSFGRACTGVGARCLDAASFAAGAGVEVEAMDYDFGPDPDDLLGVGKLTGLSYLARSLGDLRRFRTRLLYKGKHRGELEADLSLARSTAASRGPRPARFLAAASGFLGARRGVAVQVLLLAEPAAAAVRRGRRRGAWRRGNRRRGDHLGAGGAGRGAG